MSGDLVPAAGSRAPAPAPARRGPTPKGRDPLWAWPLYLALVLGVLVWAEPQTSIYHRALLPDLVAGTAYRPYVKRVLTPLAIRAGSAVMPARTRAALDRAVLEHPQIARRFGWRVPHADWYVLGTLAHAIALLGFAVAFRALARRTFALDGRTASLAAAGALALVPIHFGYQNYLYDFPSLALFTLGLLLLARDDLFLYALLWPIGILDKETYLVLLFVFLLRYRRVMPRGRLLGLAAAQVAIAAALWLVLGHPYRATPGGAVEFHLGRNLTHLPDARQLLHDVVYWGAWVVGLFFWREKRPLVADALAVLLPLLVTTLFLGFMGEYRDFYEAWPLLALLLAHTVLRILRRRPVPLRERPRGREAAAGVVGPEPAGA